MRRAERPAVLAARVTRHASMQSYLTIRALADAAYRQDAFALYAYFRWLDDQVDEHLTSPAARFALVDRQRRLLRAADDEPAAALPVPERLLVGLLRRPDGTPRSDADGARLSVTSMLDVMAFDAGRRGGTVTAAELDGYTRTLAVAVTEALHHCIGHGARAPHDGSRYVAVEGAHVAHMLRDLRSDVAAGYLNVPSELLGPGGLMPDDVASPAFRAWVRDRVLLARRCFATGREYLAGVENGRCRLAGHAYVARFEWVLDVIERDGYRLRAAYPQRSTLRGGVAIGVAATRSALAAARHRPAVRVLP